MENVPVFTVPYGREIDRDYIFLPTLLDRPVGILDIEVTVLNKDDYSAFVPENRACLIGSKLIGGGWGRYDLGWIDYDTQLIEKSKTLNFPDKRALLVGHNIKYDIHWLMRLIKVVDPFKIYTMCDIPLLWDTQLVEYLLTSQEVRMISLDNLCKMYGLSTKPTYVKEQWEKGILTKDIDQLELKKYLTHDLDATQAIFEAQLAEVHKRSYEFQVLLQMQLNMLRLVTLMEWNGLCLDTKACLDMRDKLDIKEKSLEKEIQGLTCALTITPHYPEINYTANNTVAWVLYGAPTPYITYKELVGTYKNGNPKYRNTKKVVTNMGSIGDMYLYWGTWTLPEVGPNGTRSVSEDSLLYMRSHAKSKDLIKYIDAVLEYRRITKLNGTYIAKLPTYLRSPADSLIHHNLNQSVTATGRLSSSNPNMQNRPPEVAALFKSRYAGGTIVSIDFSQIEILALAQECQDEQLLKDIHDGVDVHWVTGCSVHKDWNFKTPNDIPHKERRDIKSCNFGIIYGGSNATVSAQTGVPRDMVAKVRKALYTRYPGIAIWQDRNIVKVENASKILPDTMLGEYPAHFSILPSVTGRTYLFKDEISPEWLYKKTKLRTSFSPTQIKNFPLQGLATGDWVPCIMADYLSTGFRKDMKIVLPINTTHDDFELDAPTTYHVRALAEDFNEYLKDVFPELWKQWTGTKLLVPLSAKMKVLNEVKDE